MDNYQSASLSDLKKEHAKLEKELRSLAKSNYRIFAFLNDNQRKPMLDLVEKLDRIEQRMEELQ